jgi:hypothetical protein
MKQSAKDFIAKEEAWPLWPILPMVRIVNGQQEAAFINALGAVPPKLAVVFENLYKFTELNNDQRRALRIEVYDSADTLLEDGWRID